MTDIPLTLAALWLGSLFAYSGSLKLLASSEQKVRAIEGYRLLPLGVARICGAALPYAELTVAAVILLTPFLRYGAGIAAGFGIAFAIASGSVLARRIDTACGCTGRASERVRLATVMRAVAVAVAGGVLMVAGNPMPLPISVLAMSLAIAPSVILLRRRAFRTSLGRSSRPPVPQRFVEGSVGSQ